MDLKGYNLDEFRDFLRAISGSRFAALEALYNEDLDVREISKSIRSSTGFYISTDRIQKYCLTPLSRYRLTSENHGRVRITQFGKMVYNEVKNCAKYLSTANNTKMKEPLLLLSLADEDDTSYQSMLVRGKSIGINNRQDVDKVLKKLREQNLVEVLEPWYYRRSKVDTRGDLTKKQQDVFDRIPHNYHSLSELATRFGIDRGRMRWFLEKLREKRYVIRKSETLSYKFTAEGAEVVLSEALDFISNI